MLAGQLAVALSSEGVDLDVLAALFEVIGPAEITAIVATEPTSAATRRLWFLYEWMTGHELDVAEPAGRLEFVPVLDPTVQVALEIGVPSARHRVIDNLPGTRRYCPMVRWTPALRAAAAKKLDDRAEEILWTVIEQRRRVESTLQLLDARSSFALERENPSSACEARWADAIGQAGVRPLSIQELERLRRLSEIGTRTDDHVCAVSAIIEYTERALCGTVDPVIAAAATAFGFVHVQNAGSIDRHIHRWLVHYVLDAGGFRPSAGVLPISAAFMRAADRYERLLTTPSHCSRFFDATAHAEFLYCCVDETVKHDLPHVVRSLDGAPRRQRH
jgi:hypothetical protein